MPGKRSEVWRMVRLSKLKFEGFVIARRFKRLAEAMAKELSFELEVLDLLEKDVFAELQAKGVASEVWDHYAGFSKRVWKARVAFTDQTYAKELAALVAEYTLRGLDPGILAQLQPIAEARALQKLALS